ncbi:MAG: hypothetical protein R2864_06010 [Syntrophotaleaceae bacterium]
MVTAFAGGRPGTHLCRYRRHGPLMVTLVKTHGLEYLLAATC